MLHHSLWAQILVSVPVLLVILSGLYKIAGSAKVINSLQQINMQPYRYLLGAGEIIGAVLFLYPPTSPYGFLLLACYFSGAIAVDLSHGRPAWVPLIIEFILFITAGLTIPGWFAVN